MRAELEKETPLTNAALSCREGTKQKASIIT